MQQLKKVSGASLHGVASRNPANAAAFARSHGFRTSYNSYQQLCEDSQIDAVYIATPTVLHREHCLLVLAHDKAVLCEKPFTMTAGEAEEVATVARERGLFAMEAMWMRFNPLVQNLREAIRNGSLGTVRSLHAEVGWSKAGFQQHSAMEKGTMLSFGCYALSLAWFLLGPPTGYEAHIVRNEQGLDISCGMLLHYPATLATLNTSVAATQSNELLVVGDDGMAKIHSTFIDANSMDLFGKRLPKEKPIERAGRISRSLRRLFPSLPAAGLVESGAGFRGEIEETMRCLASGRTESDVMPLDESIAIHRCLDRIRTQPI